MAAAQRASRMEREIAQIPGLVERFLGAHRPDITQIARVVRTSVSVTLAARGTSDHAAMFGRYLFETELGLHACLAAPSTVTIYGARVGRPGSLVVAVSQSGRSPDLVAYLERAAAGGARTLAITNDAASPLARVAELVLELEAGPELAVAATKTYVMELLALLSIVAVAGRAARLEAQLARLPDDLRESLEEARSELDRKHALVEEVAGAGAVVVLGRGFNYATALETALKLTETARVFAAGFSAADYAHGPVALSGRNTPVIAFRPPGPAGRAVAEMLPRVMAAGSPVWTIGDDAGGGSSRWLGLPALPADPASALVLALPGLLIAERVARRLGLDPDSPPGLTKITETL